jgi:hypothetical protein
MARAIHNSFNACTHHDTHAAAFIAPPAHWLELRRGARICAWPSLQLAAPRNGHATNAPVPPRWTRLPGASTAKVPSWADQPSGHQAALGTLIPDRAGARAVGRHKSRRRAVAARRALPLLHKPEGAEQPTMIDNTQSMIRPAMGHTSHFPLAGPAEQPLPTEKATTEANSWQSRSDRLRQAGKRTLIPASQYEPAGHRACPVRWCGASGALPVENHPTDTAEGLDDPAGQYTDAARGLLAPPPQAWAWLEMEPSGQKNPPVHGCSRSATSIRVHMCSLPARSRMRVHVNRPCRLASSFVNKLTVAHPASACKRSESHVPHCIPAFQVGQRSRTVRQGIASPCRSHSSFRWDTARCHSGSPPKAPR